MELFNRLRGHRRQDVEDFLTFIPIYESKRRTGSLKALLKRHHKHILGKTVMEAGAGKGIFSMYMADLGARKALAVERSAALYDLLETHTAHCPSIQCHCEDITDFIPDEPVSLLFHELYGPLVLDETLLALRELKFDPGLVLPDGGRLWAMPVSEAEIHRRNPHYEPVWAKTLRGALVSDLITGIPFLPRWEVFSWDIHSPQTCFEFSLPEPCDFLAFCGEITHCGRSVLKMWWTHNWPIIYTPVNGKRFQMRFEFMDGYTSVFFAWK